MLKTLTRLVDDERRGHVHSACGGGKLVLYSEDGRPPGLVNFKEHASAITKLPVEWTACQ